MSRARAGRLSIQDINIIIDMDVVTKWVGYEKSVNMRY